jgi:hypothetical protein
LWELRNYERSIDDFVRDLTTPEIQHWESIDESTARSMLRQVFDNIDDDVLSARVGHALERRYGKESGAVIGWIYCEDKGIDEVIELLKKDTRIYL